MELTEAIETINRQLVDSYGIDTVTGKPMWRVVWSEDQLEKRRVNITDEGLALLYPIVREVKKYSYIKERYILERLVLIPDVNEKDLPTLRQSYEPMWVFEDAAHQYLPPKYLAARFVIDSVLAAQGKSSLCKYVDEELQEGVQEGKVQKIHDELFGNETPVGDALAHGTGIVVPYSYDKNKEN